jgi:hypothetical protein
MRDKGRDTRCCVASSCLAVTGFIAGSVVAVILLPHAEGNDDSSSNSTSYDAVATNMTQLLKLKMK